MTNISIIHELELSNLVFMFLRICDAECNVAHLLSGMLEWGVNIGIPDAPVLLN